jgi:hypothetical protein
MNAVALPTFGSISDAETNVSEVITDLARLSDLTSVPRVCDPHGLADLDEPAMWMVSVVRLGMCVQAILDMSPISEEETVRLLARLVGTRIVTFSR